MRLGADGAVPPQRSLLLRYTYRNDSGHYQSTGWSQVSLLKPFAIPVLSRFVV